MDRDANPDLMSGRADMQMGIFITFSTLNIFPTGCHLSLCSATETP